ncbi:hypothetical protein ONR57_21290 [Hoyosella sp. YIM 151337]|uniref:DUF6802 family protein n=1 Tax=Hoyosella sp. YIM 151337 TaxID=2992742 RepID=UPI0022364B3C|nr:DUF6802 family protein [Hoyosella sp. YIM 151337]MCW4355843.1 hypothetical protein [Hoyosella sp. YIM 151337]
MWTPDELGAAECLGTLLDGTSAELCRAELLNPTIDMSGDGVADSGRFFADDLVYVGTDETGDGFADTVTEIAPDGKFDVWELAEDAASGAVQWRLGKTGLIA